MNRTILLTYCLLAPATLVGAGQTAATEAIHSVLDGAAALEIDNLTVPAGTTLEVRGKEIGVRTSIVVEAGAHLVLVPDGNRPTHIHSVDEDGFYITVEGTMSSAGTPRTIIEGLGGEGLNSVVQAPGGIKVNGTADLRDIVVHSGQAGLIVTPGGHLSMTDGEFYDLYLMGLAVRGGQASLTRVWAHDNIIGVTGKDNGCHISITQSILANWAANLQSNGCAVDIESSILRGSTNNVVNGNSVVNVRNSTVEGYELSGFRAENGAGLVLEHVKFAAGRPRDEIEAARAGDEQNAVMARSNARVILDGVEIVGNRHDGIRAHGALVAVYNTTFERNGAHGIEMVGSAVDGLHRARYDGNVEGPVSQPVAFTATLQGLDGAALEGLQVVVRDHHGVSMFNATAEKNRPFIIEFDAFASHDGQKPHFSGPFTYQATAPGLEGVIEGFVDINATALALSATPPAPDGPSPVVVGAGVLAAVLLGALVWVNRSRKGTQ